MVKAKEFSWWSMILLSAVPYIFWQGMYWKVRGCNLVTLKDRSTDAAFDLAVCSGRPP